MKIRAFQKAPLLKAFSSGFILLIATSSIFSVASAADPCSLRLKHTVPNNKKVVASVCGDLDSDGIGDAVEVFSDVKNDKAEAEEPGTAVLNVYLGKKDGTLELSTKSLSAVCTGCGGIKGEYFPFYITIKRGVLNMGYYGGSRETGAALQSGDLESMSYS